MCAGYKRRLRDADRVDYNENKKCALKNRSRPRTEYAEVKEKIRQTVQRITELDKFLFVYNRRKDEIAIDDVSEIEDLLDESDPDSDSENCEEVEESGTDDDDREFSLEYGYIADVSDCR